MDQLTRIRSHIIDDKTVDKVRGKHPQKDPGSDAEASAPEQTPEEPDESLEYEDEILPVHDRWKAGFCHPRPVEDIRFDGGLQSFGTGLQIAVTP